MQDVFEGRSTQIPYVQVSVKAHPNTDGFKDDFHCALTINGININGSIHGAPKIVIEKSLSDISDKSKHILYTLMTLLLLTCRTGITFPISTII